MNLGDGSFVRMTSVLDAEAQELDAAGIAMWGDTSAYFNGETVLIELIGGANTSNNRIVLERVAVEFDDTQHLLGTCGICGADDRVPSVEEWTGRLMPVGCTASVWSENSCLVTAGHCIQNNLVIEFRVPNSGANCGLRRPPLAEQFPITDFRFRNGGVGNDWAVMTSGRNNLNETVFERYGRLRRIAGTLGSPGQPIDVWGYGIDENQCIRTQTQQVHDGTIVNRTGTYYDINVDITFGNSGSAVIRNGEIIGIVTHCRVNCPNIATRVDRSDFVAARDALCPGETPVLPDSFTIVRGQLLSGDLNDLFESDDSRLFVRRSGFAPTIGPPVQVEVRGTSPEPSPSELRFRFEGAVDQSSIEQRILMYDFVSRSYEEVDLRTASNTDAVVEIVISDNPSRFVEPGTGAMRTLLTWEPMTFGGWIVTAAIDQTVWSITD